MKNYKTTDYAINKYSEAIVYRFDDKIIEVTLEQYLVENPTKTEEDYKRLKAISDDIYLVQDRADNAQTKKNVSIHSFEEIESFGACSMEEDYIDKQEKLRVRRAVYQLLKNDVLTIIQKRRFELFFLKGLSTRRIAEIEHARQNAVWESIKLAQNKLIKLFDGDWSTPL